MLQLLRYAWDDTFAFIAAAGMLIGIITAYFPPIAPKMSSSYGYWIAGISAAVFLYRIFKAAILFRFGQRTEARIVEHYLGWKGTSKLTYFFRHEIDTDDEPTHFNVTGKWETQSQNRELSIAYWKSYPSFHIAYWNYNSINRSQHDSELDLLKPTSEKTKSLQDFS